MQNMSVDLTPIVQTLIALLASIITVFLVPWIKAKTTAQQQALLYATIKSLVYGAEQLLGAGGGAEKMNYVTRGLEQRGLKVDTAAIEASVRELSLETMWAGADTKVKTEQE